MGCWHYEESSDLLRNIEMLVVNGRLILQVDLSQDLGPSKTGKTRLIASSSGNGFIPGYEGVRLSLSVYRYPEAAPTAA
jgi:hypothetical protein